MGVVNKLFLYARHISFILFLYAGIILYPGFVSTPFNCAFFIVFLIYSLLSFVFFFIKSSGEQGSFLNNFVLCFLHIYFLFVAFRYDSSVGLDFSGDFYFFVNYLVLSFVMIVLCVNKFILMALE